MPAAKKNDPGYNSRYYPGTEESLGYHNFHTSSVSGKIQNLNAVIYISYARSRYVPVSGSMAMVSPPL